MTLIPPEIRFWMYVLKTDGCWIWMGATNHHRSHPNARGRFTPYKGTWIYAPRYSWQLANGPIPDGMVIRHKCDTPLCVNPDHLETGTQGDNMRDAAKRGRLSKINPADIPAIRIRCASGESQPSIAKSYGVCQTTISAIARGENWSHL